MKMIVTLLFFIPFSLVGQKNIGIGIESPASRLHIHQNDSSSDPISLIRMTNTTSGSTSTDGLRLQISGNTVSLMNQEAGTLSLGTSNISRLHLLPNGSMGYNTTQNIGSADFTIRSNDSFFGGMYIDSPNTNNDGKPFYGYALDGLIAAYQYFDAEDGLLKTQFADKSAATFSFQSDGVFLMNTNEPINAFTDLSLRTRGGSFGGMYIDAPTSSTKPFYGYSVNGITKSFHYYDEVTGNWILNTGIIDAINVNTNGDVGLGNSDPDEKLVINGRLRLQSSNTVSAANGTIVFNGANFYGRINDAWYKMTNATTGPGSGSLTTHSGDDQEFLRLKAQNEALTQKLKNMEERLLQLETALSKL